MQIAYATPTALPRSTYCTLTAHQKPGIARPNIAAYEAGRREPRLSTATQLLAAVDVHLTTTPSVTWTWTSGQRPYAMPSQLWRLPIHRALATITTRQHLWWSVWVPDIRSWALTSQDAHIVGYP